KDLPVVLPEDLVPDGSGNPLNQCEAFLRCACPRCGKPARRETDTMDTFVDSAWYYLRYCSPQANTMVDARNDYWMPMDQYIGGIEHAVLHLLYARFWTKVMRDLGLLKFDEPFMRLMNQGFLLNHVFFRRNDKGGKEYFPPSEVTVTHDSKGHVNGGALADGTPVEYGGVGKMGKTERNGVDPQKLIDTYGADTARLFVMFVGSPEDSAVWSDTAVEGAQRYLRRLWAWCAQHAGAVAEASAQAIPPTEHLSRELKNARYEVHAALAQANFDYERMQYNTVVSAAMKMLNALESLPCSASHAPAVLREGALILLRVLYPIAPHITVSLWEALGFEQTLGSLLDAPWPEPDAQALVREEIEIGVQVNGKLRASIRIPAQADEASVRALALADAHVQKFVEDKPLKFFKFIPGKLVSIAV
ncbi:MAG TPA: class I tRNA ligase family protein, partial [Burkholderiaceae bacterium]|nr:class I tRNA ligase family protein [Burkholderiaceae bacterium]